MTLESGESITFTGTLPGTNHTPETLYKYKAAVTANKTESSDVVSDSDTWAAKPEAFSGMLPAAGAFPWLSVTGVALLAVGTLVGGACIIVRAAGQTPVILCAAKRSRRI